MIANKGERNLSKTIGKRTKKIFIALIIIIVIVLLILVINKQMIKVIYKKDYAEYVTKYSQEYGVEENLIFALIKGESNFNVKAISNKNAQGLMQLMYTTAKEIANESGLELNEENILEPETNINLGTKYISNLLEKYKYVEVALAAYNAGSGTVDKWIRNGTIKADGSDIENIPYKETNTYVRKILRDYKIYSQLEG